MHVMVAQARPSCASQTAVWLGQAAVGGWVAGANAFITCRSANQHAVWHGSKGRRSRPGSVHEKPYDAAQDRVCWGGMGAGRLMG